MARRLPLGFMHWTMIVRERVTPYERDAIIGQRVQSSETIARLAGPRALSEDVERMYVIGLDGRNGVRFLCEVARGGLHGCSVAARDILRPVIMGHASGFVLVHNHPSGDPTPSPEDVAMTRAVAAAAEVVGVPLLDHVVVAAGPSDHPIRHVSMLDLGILPLP